MKGVLLDTGILIRGLGQRDDSDAASCRRLIDRLKSRRITMYMAAPSYAEMTRGGGVPGWISLEFVPFNRRAAEACGRTFPHAFLVDVRRHVDLREHYVKYDAMIVSCALAHDIGAVVSLDRGVHVLCQKAGLDCYTADALNEVLGFP
ncbi:MAG: PIN domain-containing protein [bacterium]